MEEQSRSDEVTFFVIGDPHFKHKNIKEGHEFIDRLIEYVQQAKPDYIVSLGDNLDTHEIVRVQAHKLVERFIAELSAIAPLYVLIGNHDLINASQFLTDNHIFCPFKRWDNVNIVDKPTVLEVDRENKSYSFIFCPFVPPGKFVEALDTLSDQGVMWNMATCIFAHQEMEGCMLGIKPSEIGDSWSKDNPPIISGHIHDEQCVGENIYYPGSSRQHGFSETSVKRVWYVTFTEDEIVSEEGETLHFYVEKIDLGIKSKKLVSLNIEEVENFDFSETDDFIIKLRLTGTSAQFKAFRKSQLHAKLKRLGVTIDYDPIKGDTVRPKGNHEASNYETILKELVMKKGENVQRAYEEVLGSFTSDCEVQENVVYELIFAN